MGMVKVDSSRNVVAFVTIDSAILSARKLGQRMKELEAYHFVPTLVLLSTPSSPQSPVPVSKGGYQ
jgi:hypothetical protein